MPTLRTRVAIFVLTVFFTGIAAVGILLKILKNPVKALKRKTREIPPAWLLDPSLGTHEYVRANGINFHYVSAGSKSKPLMLFLHGFPEFWFSWRHQIRAFSADYHVVAVDMRGYGESDKPPHRSDYELPALKKDIVELIPALGYEKCVLVAHDWGGIIAWHIADEHPDLIQNLVVMNCPHPRIFAGDVKKARGWKQIRKSWYMFLFQAPWLPEFIFSLNDYALFNDLLRGPRSGVKNGSMMTDDVLEAYKYVFSQLGALTPPINYYRNMLFTLQKKASGSKTAIEIPTLLVWGDEDHMLRASMADRHTTVCSNITVKHIPNCSHWVQQDNPELVNQYMREFLSTKN